MAAAYQGIPVLRNSLHLEMPITFHPTSALANPQNSRFYSEWRLATEELLRKLKGSGDYNEDERSGKHVPSITASEYNNNDKVEISRKNFSPVTAQCVVKDAIKYNNDEYGSLRASAEIRRPRPQKVPWQKELANRVSAEICRPRPKEVPWQKELFNGVHFIGKIGQPVEFSYVRSGRAFAKTSLGVSGPEATTMWLTLTFWDELAETAVQHLKKYDRVHVSGVLALQTTAGEDDKLQKYKVIVNTLNFVPCKSPAFSEQVVVNENTPSPIVSQPTLSYGVTPFQYQRSQIKSSSSGKNSGENAAFMRSSWDAFFNNPDDWWDNRQNKRNPWSPDFKHKDTGMSLWINKTYTPPWVKSMLAKWDSRMKVP